MIRRHERSTREPRTSSVVRDARSPSRTTRNGTRGTTSDFFEYGHPWPSCRTGSPTTALSVRKNHGRKAAARARCSDSIGTGRDSFDSVSRNAGKARGPTDGHDMGTTETVSLRNDVIVGRSPCSPATTGASAASTPGTTPHRRTEPAPSRPDRKRNSNGLQASVVPQSIRTMIHQQSSTIVLREP